MYAWCQQKSEEGIGSSESGVKDGCESSLWVPGIDTGPLARATMAINHRAISLSKVALNSLQLQLHIIGLLYSASLPGLNHMQ